MAALFEDEGVSFIAVLVVVVVVVGVAVVVVVVVCRFLRGDLQPSGLTGLAAPAAGVWQESSVRPNLFLVSGF